MNLEEPTEPDALTLNEPENESEDGNSGQALHRGTATEITTDHSYIYAGGKLLRETITEDSTTKTLDFTYDNVGMPYSLIYSDGTTTTTYYYITNLQGDVMYLVDASGNEVAAYDYDPYGKIISAAGAMADVNPLRYRGYYYDSETGFYYLQSRYYDPEICRFINGDKYSATATGYLGYNMFAYCNNNPIIAADYDGEWLNIVIGAVIGGAINLGIALWEHKPIDEVIVSTICGAAGGALTAMGFGAVAGAVTSFIDSGYENAKKVYNNETSIGKAIADTAVNTALGLAFGAMGSADSAGIAKSAKISAAGMNGIKALVKSTIHPTVKKAAKQALKDAAKYAGKQLVSETASGIVAAGITKGMSKLMGKIYIRYAEMW